MLYVSLLLWLTKQDMSVAYLGLAGQDCLKAYMDAMKQRCKQLAETGNVHAKQQLLVVSVLPLASRFAAVLTWQGLQHMLQNDHLFFSAVRCKQLVLVPTCSKLHPCLLWYLQKLEARGALIHAMKDQYPLWVLLQTFILECTKLAPYPRRRDQLTPVYDQLIDAAKDLSDEVFYYNVSDCQPKYQENMTCWLRTRHTEFAERKRPEDKLTLLVHKLECPLTESVSR